jgi:exonuclease 3'-5' domain-containing protein 2
MKLQPKSKKIYENCAVHHPNGDIMFRCNRKRAMWYLERGLAEVLSEEPLVIQLSFEPRGYGSMFVDSGPRMNVCHVCGIEHELTLHHVVPMCFKRHADVKDKEHTHFECIPLCVECHSNYEKKADELKELLINEYSKNVDRYIRLKLHVRKYNDTLTLHSDSMPENRIAEIKESIARAQDELNTLKINNKFEDSLNYTMVYKNVVDIVGYENLVTMWREHFFNCMNPQHLPEWWDINMPITKK